MLNANITAITAGLCALILLMQTASVIQTRVAKKIVDGDAGDARLIKRQRGHGNMVEQGPIFLILMLLAETYVGASAWLLGILAALFVLGRASHAAYYLDIGLGSTFRGLGMMGTLTGQIGLMLIVLIGAIF